MAKSLDSRSCFARLDSYAAITETITSSGRLLALL